MTSSASLDLSVTPSNFYWFCLLTSTHLYLPSTHRYVFCLVVNETSWDILKLKDSMEPDETGQIITLIKPVRHAHSLQWLTMENSSSNVSHHAAFFSNWQWYNVQCIILIISIFFSDSGSKMYLHELLAGSEVYVEPLKLPEKVGANLFDVYIFLFQKQG